MTTLDVGGQKRNFLLKMREGVIYFKEPTRTPVFAITRLFQMEWRGEALIDQWKAELGKENYGRFVGRHVYVSRVPASTLVAMIHRADGSGWAREWFDEPWLELPPHRDGKGLNLWGVHSFHVANRRAIRRLRPQMLERTLPENRRTDIKRRWICGSEAEAQEIVPHVLRLFAPSLGNHYRYAGKIPLELRSCCPGSNGYFNQYSPTGGWFYLFRVTSPLRWAFSLLQQHLAFEEFSWSNYQEKQPENRSSYLDQNEISEGNNRWGHDWRGNFYFSSGQVRFDLEPFSPPTAHERLESLLAFRDWLDDKVSPEQIARFLKRAQEQE